MIYKKIAHTPDVVINLLIIEECVDWLLLVKLKFFAIAQGK